MLLNKSILVIGIVFLLVCSAFIPMSLGINTRTTNTREQPSTFSRGKTLYVGGIGPDNYTKIQDAIDDADDGDTVFVFNDSSPYHENVVVDKSITLIGEDRDTTVINGSGSGNVVHVSANCCVNISGFTVENSGSWLYNAGIDLLRSNYCVIVNNRVSYNRLGILFEYSNNNYISGNSITGNYDHGICIINDSFFNNVSDNCIIGNGYYGIALGQFSNNNNVTNNSVIGNPVGIKSARSSINILHNNISSCSQVGIDLDSSSHSNIYGNKITNCGAHGIWANDRSDFNTISRNEIFFNSNGLFFQNVKNNTISDNNINSNNFGIKIIDFGNNNVIYHNNFINNTGNNAVDVCDNIWDDGYPSGGNYWDDYTGEDNNDDGIGDTPYSIPGLVNQDNYPLMYPWGENLPVAHFTYSVNESPVLFDGSTSYDRDGEIISYEWDFGDGKTGYGEITCHKYCDIGIYDVTLTVTDNDGSKGNITKRIEVILANIPPLKPEIYGPNSGRPRVEYEYVFIMTDPDGDEFYLWVEWGDGASTGWMGPYNSGEPVKLSYKWNESGKYVIKAKLKDFCDESEWSYFEVTMPRSRITTNTLFLRFLEQFPILQKILCYIL